MSVCYKKDNFDCVEEFLYLRQLLLTTGEDILKELKNVTGVNKVEWGRLDSVYTNGAPCIVSKKRFFCCIS